MTPTHEAVTVYMVAAWIALAVIGGVARYLDEYIRTGKTFSGPALLANGFVSGFSGYMCAEIAMRTNPDWALISAGVGGYLGTQALEYVREIVFKRLGKD